MHFTGQMPGTDKANFGRSKQNSKLIGLVLSIDSLSFVRYSKFYNGNISEPETFEDMLRNVTCQLDTRWEKPIIVMDAGIVTEENLEIIRSNKFNYNYVCVSSISMDYTHLSVKAETICDNRGNKIELTKVAAEGKDDIFYILKVIKN
jgi:transposase